MILCAINRIGKIVVHDSTGLDALDQNIISSSLHYEWSEVDSKRSDLVFSPSSSLLLELLGYRTTTTSYEEF